MGTRFRVIATRAKWRIGTLAVVVLVVASVGVVVLRGRVVDTKTTAAHFGLSIIHQALKLHKKQYGTYPTADQSLSILCDHAGQRGFLTCPHALNDPWGNPYVYRLRDAQAQIVQLYSRGANGIDEGGEGDDIIEAVAP